MRDDGHSGKDIQHSIDRIVDHLTEIRKDQKEMKDLYFEHKIETIGWQAATSERLVLIEVDLREHKEGVINNRSLLKAADRRLELLEEPSKVIQGLKKALVFVASIAAALLTISKLKDLL